jgi:hypothetical protein
MILESFEVRSGQSSTTDVMRIVRYKITFIILASVTSKILSVVKPEFLSIPTVTVER